MRALLRDLCLESCVFRALVLQSIISSKQSSVKTHMVVHDYVWRQNAGKSGLNSKKLCFVARRSVQQSLRESAIHTLRHTRISTPQFRSHILSTITLPIHTFFTLISHLPISRWTGLGVDLMTSELQCSPSRSVRGVVCPERDRPPGCLATGLSQTRSGSPLQVRRCRHCAGAPAQNNRGDLVLTEAASLSKRRLRRWLTVGMPGGAGLYPGNRAPGVAAEDARFCTRPQSRDQRARHCLKAGQARVADVTAGQRDRQSCAS